MEPESRFARLLREKNINLTQLRREVSRQTLRNHLLGKRPSIEFSLRYAKLLGMSLDKFYKYLEG